MYDPACTAAAEEALLRRVPALRTSFPQGIPEYSVADSQALTAQVLSAADESGQPLRPLTPEEQTFVEATVARCGFDYPYWARRFAYIDDQGTGLRALYPLWESQEYLIQMLGRLERQRQRDRSPDGLLLNILKIRQVGITTLGVTLLAHRIYLRPHIRALVGSDVEPQAGYLFRIATRVYDQLPWFLKPAVIGFNKDREQLLGNQSSLRTAWGKTTRGALQEVGGKKGNIERGRSQPLTEPVLTPFGWRPMGEITAGDLVMGADGRPARVIATYPQEDEDVYRVRFTDGSWTECSGDHLWQVTTTYRQWAGYGPVVRRTADLLAGGLRWDKASGPQVRWYIPITKPVQFPARRLPLAPYIVGVLIGDGCTRYGMAQISCRDVEVRERVQREMPEGCRIDLRKNGDWHIRATGRNPVVRAIDQLGLRAKYSYEKHIPEEYLYTAIPDRIALLQGLMDSDGTANRRQRKVNFCTTSPQLARDFRTLVESLGGVARVTERPIKPSHYSRKTKHMIHSRRGSFVFSVRLPPEIVPFSLPRKVAQLAPVEERKYPPSRGIVDIEYGGRKPTQCIHVDTPDHLYLTRHCVVTHNTYATVHISELATWDNPDQLDTALLPGIPLSPQTLVLFESTAELPEDWWHHHWRTSASGQGRFRNLFIAAYAVPSKYALPPPEGWVPKSTTIQWVNKAEAESALWCLGQTVRPSKAQAYWYETTRAFYESKGKLHDFKREYPSDPEECFAYSGLSIFSHEQLEIIDQQARPSGPIDIWTVEPARDIAELSRLAEEDPAPPERRMPVPLTPALRHPIAHHEHPVPPGYGFRRVPPSVLRQRLEADNKDPHVRFEGFLALWEYPRLRGSRRYIMSVDVGDGVGLDYSVIDVIRMPSVEEAAEQVAQYVSNQVTPNQLAAVADAIGRYYADLDGLEALAAVESNIGPGLVTQNDLQLHLGYTHFYVWEVLDAAQSERRYTTRIGWATTSKSRPIIISRLHDALTTQDPISQSLDLRINSAVTRHELRHLIIPKVPGARLGDAEAAPGQHDDAILASAIGYYVAWQQAGGETEPIAEKRRRRAALHALQQEPGQRIGDWRNTATTAEEMQAQTLEDDDLVEAPAGMFFGDRGRA